MIVKDRESNGGRQVLHQFENGYGASVIQGPYSYGGDEGLYELAVIVWEGETYGLTYDTPITSDVLGYLTPEEVDEALARIEALPEVQS